MVASSVYSARVHAAARTLPAVEHWSGPRYREPIRYLKIYVCPVTGNLLDLFKCRHPPKLAAAAGGASLKTRGAQVICVQM